MLARTLVDDAKAAAPELDKVAVPARPDRHLERLGLDVPRRGRPRGGGRERRARALDGERGDAVDHRGVERAFVGGGHRRGGGAAAAAPPPHGERRERRERRERGGGADGGARGRAGAEAGAAAGGRRRPLGAAHERQLHDARQAQRGRRGRGRAGRRERGRVGQRRARDKVAEDVEDRAARKLGARDGRLRERGAADLQLREEGAVARDGREDPRGRRVARRAREQRRDEALLEELARAVGAREELREHGGAAAGRAARRRGRVDARGRVRRVGDGKVRRGRRGVLKGGEQRGVAGAADLRRRAPEVGRVVEQAEERVGARRRHAARRRGERVGREGVHRLQRRGHLRRLGGGQDDVVHRVHDAVAREEGLHDARGAAAWEERVDADAAAGRAADAEVVARVAGHERERGGHAAGREELVRGVGALRELGVERRRVGRPGVDERRRAGGAVGRPNDRRLVARQRAEPGRVLVDRVELGEGARDGLVRRDKGGEAGGEAPRAVALAHDCGHVIHVLEAPDRELGVLVEDVGDREVALGDLRARRQARRRVRRRRTRRGGRRGGALPARTLIRARASLASASSASARVVAHVRGICRRAR